MPYEERWYIEEALNATFDYFDKKGGTNRDGSPVKANPVVALPTGTGKSYWVAEFNRRALLRFPQTRIINATHDQNIIGQNVERMRDVWPDAPLGIHSAGLGERVTDAPLIFGGIKSMVKHGGAFGYRDLCVIDEAHLVSPNAETQYQEFLTALTMLNPYLKIVLLSATPYRMGLGHLTNGNIATDVAYNLCTLEGFNRLIAEGYLSPVISKKTATELPLTGVGISASTGDFNESALNRAINNSAITYSALQEVVNYGYERRSWMIFAASIEHAENIALMLRGSFGVPVAAVHSKMPRKEVEAVLAAFKRGELRCIVNKDILTTGFDHPPIDLIAMLRPTLSTGLWVQMVGRGMRPFDWFRLSLKQQTIYRAFYGFVKQNCLILDFAGNTQRLGPVNDPVIPRAKGDGKPGDAAVKLCDQCGTYNHASRRTCEGCGKEFDIAYRFEPNIDNVADDAEVLRSTLPQVEWLDVQRVVYDRHTAKSGSISVKAAYYCGLRTFYEYIKFEDAKPFAIHKAHDWLRQRTVYAEEAIAHMDSEFMEGQRNDYVLSGSGSFRIPKKIRVWLNRPEGPAIEGYEF